MATWNASLKARDTSAGLFLRHYSVGELAFVEGGAAVLVGDHDKMVLSKVENAGGELAFSFVQASASDVRPSKVLSLVRGGIQPDRMIFKFLEDAAGNESAVGNYSDAGDGLTEFTFEPKPGQVIEIHRLLVQIRDAGAPDAGKYGNSLVLANGIKVTLRHDDSTLLDLTNGTPVKTNQGWARLCFDADPDSFGTGDDYVSVRWSFDKAGRPIVLSGDHGEKLVVTFNDDFSALVSHYFQVQGVITKA